MAGKFGDKSELGAALARYRFAFGSVALLSAVLNVLLLGGSIYMMLVYDSVLPSHSIPTLIGLLAMISLVYIAQAVFDLMRSRILGDVGTALDAQLSARVQQVISEASLKGSKMPGDGLVPMRDLDSIRTFLSGTGPSTLIDLPWIIFFLAILFMLHFWLGATALVGALILIGLTFLTDRATKEPIRELTLVTSMRNGMAESNLRHVEVLTSMGMRNRMRERWEGINQAYLSANVRLAHSIGMYGGLSKVFRMFLQSGILTVGALLVIDGKASGGVIFASSILSGRALAPVDQAIANWKGFSQARAGWARLRTLLERVPAEQLTAVVLPLPKSTLEVRQLVVVPPGSSRVTVSNADFRVDAGHALGVIGPSAAGKTSLARALVGVWPSVRGTIRLDGATLDQWENERRGSAIGYLPQTVELLEGTVAENIARFDPEASSEKVIAAAQAAGVHDLIVHLPEGYSTQVGADGSGLSAGQRQRIGLARALYGDPFLVLLDEPNSNLDAAGESGLEQAILSVRERGGIAIVIAHRPSALAHVTHVLFMRDGKSEAFGPRDEVLRKITTSTAQTKMPRGKLAAVPDAESVSSDTASNPQPNVES